ncbi:MAG TPA: sporulation protein [Anaerolineae bacterium]|mgnify:FL=1|nr:sporulation protein [Anaerolineae bacterium]HPL27774.1 sporulation protein [Anaerolineae bacterium]
MFGLFGGGKASVKVALERTRYQPGETIPVLVTVTGEKDLNIREGRVALICHEEYQYRYEERRRDANGRWSTHDKLEWQRAQGEAGKHVFLGEGTVRAGSSERYECNFTLPPDALPSCPNGKILRLRWAVRATLDRKMAGDIEDEAEVLVYHAPRGLSGTGPFGRSNQPEEAALSLAVPTLEWALGETIEGQLLVRPVKSFGVSEVRVELLRVEQVHGAPDPAVSVGVHLDLGLAGKRVKGNEATQVEKVKVQGGVKLEASQEMAFPFRITIPTAPVTARLHDGTVRWMLKGILARTLRSDTQVEQEIVVYGAR